MFQFSVRSFMATMPSDASGRGLRWFSLVLAGAMCTACPNDDEVPQCGDGIISGAEACDDGNSYGGDGCTESCLVEDGYACEEGLPCVVQYDGVCGDGLLGYLEECDDGNAVDGDGCSASCALEAGYECSGLSCLAVCGDGIVVDAEQCDDGEDNGSSYGGCNVDCTVGGYCGDGVINAPWEECDDGADNGPSYGGCAADCSVGPYCGDGIINAPEEQCDDGENTGGAGACAPGCVLGE